MITKDKLILDTSLLSESDNVGAYVRDAAGNLITSTLIGSKQSLDVYDQSNKVEDAAHTTGDIGSFILAVRNDADTTMVGADGDYAPLQVDSTGRLKVAANFIADFDFVYDEDSAHASGNPGAFMLGVRNDSNAVLTSADGDYSPFSVDSTGRLKTGSEQDEDSAHSSGQAGNYVLAVRQDTLVSSVSADGDYASFKLNERGGLWSVPVGTVSDDAADTENPVKIGSRAKIGALPAISTDGDRADMLSDKFRRIYVNSGPNVAALNTAATVTDTAANLLTGNLSGRRRYLIQNLGNRAIFIGKDATVTDSNGFRMAAGSNMDIELGEDVSLFAITTSGSQDIRILELA